MECLCLYKLEKNEELFFTKKFEYFFKRLNNVRDMRKDYN